MTLRRHLGTRLLPPDPKGFSALTPILIGNHQVPPWTEVAIDYRVRRQEPMGLQR